MTDQIPDNWKKIKLCKIGVFSTSSVDKKIDDKETYVSLLNYMDIYKNSIIKDTYNFQKVTSTEKEISSFSVKNGDVFFTPSSETPNDIGHSAVFIGDLNNLVHSYHTIRFRSKTNEYLDDTYKKYAFKGDSTYEYFRKQATGSTRFTLSLTAFNQCEVLVPPLPEQKEIASILTSVDEVIENTQKQIDKLQDLKKATMNELLTKGIGHTEFKDSEFGRIPKSWEVKYLGDFSNVTKLAGFEYTEHFDYSIGGEIIALRALNLNDGKLDLTDIQTIPKSISDALPRSKLFYGDILISYVGSVGEIGFIYDNDRFHLAPNVAKISCDLNQVNAQFILQQLLSDQAQKNIQNLTTITSQPSLNMANIRKIRLSICSIKEQDNIVKILSSIDNKLDNLNQKFVQIKNLKKSLMQNLLTGKVRVKVN